VLEHVPVGDTKALLLRIFHVNNQSGKSGNMVHYTISGFFCVRHDSGQ